jgi:hypothetical protein
MMRHHPLHVAGKLVHSACCSVLIADQDRYQVVWRVAIG